MTLTSENFIILLTAISLYFEITHHHGCLHIFYFCNTYKDDYTAFSKYYTSTYRPITYCVKITGLPIDIYNYFVYFLYGATLTFYECTEMKLLNESKKQACNGNTSSPSDCISDPLPCFLWKIIAKMVISHKSILNESNTVYCYPQCLPRIYGCP